MNIQKAATNFSPSVSGSRPEASPGHVTLWVLDAARTDGTLGGCLDGCTVDRSAGERPELVRAAAPVVEALVAQAI